MMSRTPPFRERLNFNFRQFQPRLRRVLPLLLAGLVTGGLAAADPAPETKPVIGPPSDWITPTAWIAPEKYVENSSGEDFLLLDDQTRLATDESYAHHVYQIVTDSGRQNGSQVYFYFDPSYQTLTIHQLQLIRNGEALNKLDPEKIQVIQQERDLDRQLYNGERSALVILDDVRLGDIIDFAYTLRGSNPVFAGRFIDTHSLEWGVPVRKLNYRLLVPVGRRIATRIIGGTKLAPVRQTQGDEQELVWQRSNIPIIESEDRVPSSYQVFSYLDLSEFQNWSEVVNWAEPLYALEPKPRPLLDATVADLRTQAKSPEDQAVAALAFVQQEIRYLGIEMGPGSHRPSDPEEVLRRRFGDCKDKSRLLTALLRQLGLTAAPALVHSSRREAVHDRLPSPYAFDHVITALDFNGQRYLLDPTLAYQRGDKLLLRHVGRYGPYLCIAPRSAALENAVLRERDTSDTAIKEVFQIPALEAPATLTITTTTKGRAADSLRSYFATSTPEQIGRDYLNYYNHYYPGISQAQPVEHTDNPRDNTFTSTEHYRIERLFTRQTDGKLLRAEFQPASLWDYLRTTNLGQRQQPYAISHPVHLEEQIIINLPEDWNVTPSEGKIDGEAFTVKVRIHNPTPRQIQLDHSWDSKTSRVETAQLAQFDADSQRARKALGYELTWNTAFVETATTDGSTDKSGPAPDPFPLNWPMIVLAGGVIVGGGYVSWRLIARKNPTPPAPPLLTPTQPVNAYGFTAGASAGPKGLGGWLILVAFGMFFRPGYVLYVIHGARGAYFNSRTWNLLTSPSSENYIASYALIAPLELMLNFSLLVYGILLLVLFFRCSYLLPRMFQMYLGLIVLVALFDIWSTQMIGQAVTPDSYTQLFRTIMAAAIWIPYFQVSRRVKLTFVC